MCNQQYLKRHDRVEGNGGKCWVAMARVNETDTIGDNDFFMQYGDIMYAGWRRHD